MKRIKATTVFLITSLFLFSTASYAISPYYAIYIDAGSSGSRMHVFKYEGSLSYPIVKNVFTEKVTPGLSAYAEHPKQAFQPLKKLFDDAETFIKKSGGEITKTPINIMATAGMRLVPTKKQKIIYADIKSQLKRHYRFPIKNIETISGKMEGIYGWIDINYLLGNLQQQKPTVGSLDMGGASTEIAYAVSPRYQSSDTLQMKLFGKNYTVFSKSYLYLGESQAHKAMLSSSTASACFPNGYAFTNSQSGKFDFSQCQQDYSKIINRYQTKTVFPDHRNNYFIAYSGFYYTFDFLKATPKNFSKKINKVCQLSWNEILKKNPNIKPQYLSEDCSNSVYQYVLLSKAYGLKPSQIRIADTLNNQEIDWPLGAAILAVSKEYQSS